MRLVMFCQVYTSQLVFSPSSQIPEFDNLYLDMNGIIHQCSHPNDEDVHFRISEEKIFADIFHYLEVLFRIIKPRKVFFMAVDGVAPRAKMNQQRGRRFRYSKRPLLSIFVYRIQTKMWKAAFRIFIYLHCFLHRLILVYN